MPDFTVLRQSRNNLHEGAGQVASRLRTSEVSIDTAITDLAALTTSMIEMRREGNLSAVFGQDTLTSVGEALNTLIKGRAQLVEAHNRMQVHAGTLRINPTSYGSLEDKPG